MPPHDDPSRWAAADDMCDGYITHLRGNPMSTSEVAMMLLATDHPQRLILFSMIAATALQRLAIEQIEGETDDHH